MNPEKQNSNPENVEAGEANDRRRTLIKVGKFAAYAAPFTVFALTKKAEAATGHGPGKH
jgi:hypothetical protein